MDALVAVDELRTFMPGVTLDEDQAELVLAIASGTVRGATGQTLSLVEGDEVELRGTWGRQLQLPERPVLAVTAIAVDGVEVPATSYRWSRDGKVTFSRSSPLVNAPAAALGYWGGDEVLVTVTYDHGFDPVPDDVRGVVLALARRAILVPDAGAVAQESLGSYSVTYSREAASTLTRGEERKLCRYRPKGATLAVGPA